MNERNRTMPELRKLWDAILDVQEIDDIFTKRAIAKKNYALDHFVPWSFVTNNELWNICPIDTHVNSLKSDNLPQWEYSKALAMTLYTLYEQIWICDNSRVKNAFLRCRDKNLSAEWAYSLFNKGDVDKTSFEKEIIDHIEPLYNSAKNLGFTVWKE